jgi:lactoylglutathione lyase
MTETADPGIDGIATIGIPVTDQDRALRFYTDILGFELRTDVPLPQIGGRWIVVAPRGSEVSVALVRAGEGLPSGVETGIRFITADAEKTHQALQAGGVEVGELLRWPGIPAMFTAKDADGNGFELVEAESGR